MHMNVFPSNKRQRMDGWMDAHMMMHKCTGTCASSYIDRHDVIFTFVIVMNDGSEVEMAQRQRIAN